MSSKLAIFVVILVLATCSPVAFSQQTNTTSFTKHQCPVVLPYDNSTVVPFTISRDVAALIALLLTPTGACTATRVGPRYLLTAAHCLRDFNASASVAEYRVLFANLSDNSESVAFTVDGGRVKRFRKHPMFRDPVTKSGKFAQYDVAWLRLAGDGHKRIPSNGDSDDKRRPRRPPSGNRPFNQPFTLRHQHQQVQPSSWRSWSTSNRQTRSGSKKPPFDLFFRLVIARPDLPSLRSTLRIAGFGKFGVSDPYESDEIYYSYNYSTVDGKALLRNARQVDMSVSISRRGLCGRELGYRYNESTQICVGYGEEDDFYYGSDFQRRCIPCARDAGGPLFQYITGANYSVPVLIGIISVPRSAYCRTPYPHIRISALLSVPGFLPPDLTAFLDLVTSDYSSEVLPAQVDYPTNATGQLYDYWNNPYYNYGDDGGWRTATIVLGCLLGIALIALIVLAVLLWKWKMSKTKAAAVAKGGETAPAQAVEQQPDSTAGATDGQQQMADNIEQNVTPQDIIAPE